MPVVVFGTLEDRQLQEAFILLVLIDDNGAG